ncbi:MAG: GNAT family N-acetyltransferase [Pseudorhodoplanes sp.]
MPGDFAAVRALNERAFGGPAEAALVDRLRADGDLVLSLVAEHESGIVGHCGFSRLTLLAGTVGHLALALAPVAVSPPMQGRGIGQAMIREGLDRLAGAGETLVFVVGSPDYYRRFGFDATRARAFSSPYDGEYFQVLALSAGAPGRGAVRYARAFEAL